MKIDFLADQPAGTAFLAGPAGSRELATVVVRTSYDLVADGGNPRLMVPTNDAARHAVVYADEGTEILELNADGDLEAVEFDITYEADIALEKDQVDIVVERFRGSPPVTGSVTVDGTIWLSRAGDLSGRDVDRNLFGWHRRDEGPRAITSDTTLPGNAMDGYGPIFNNVYRRSNGFLRPVANNASLPPGGTVTITNADDTYSFVLPDPLGLQARYFTYCGHGTDKLPFWNPSALIDLRADTLIVAPVDNTAVLLWRGSWDFAAHDPALYRSIQILPEGMI